MGKQGVFWYIPWDLIVFSSLSFHSSLASSVPNLTVFHLAYFLVELSWPVLFGVPICFFKGKHEYKRVFGPFCLEPNAIHSSLLVFARVILALFLLVLCHPSTGSMRPQCRHSSGQTSPRVGVFSEPESRKQPEVQPPRPGLRIWLPSLSTNTTTKERETKLKGILPRKQARAHTVLAQMWNYSDTQHANLSWKEFCPFQRPSISKPHTAASNLQHSAASH